VHTTSHNPHTRFLHQLWQVHRQVTHPAEAPHSSQQLSTAAITSPSEGKGHACSASDMGNLHLCWVAHMCKSCTAGIGCLWPTPSFSGAASSSTSPAPAAKRMLCHAMLSHAMRCHVVPCCVPCMPEQHCGPRAHSLACWVRKNTRHRPTHEHDSST
jgi:hypothetical protein